MKWYNKFSLESDVEVKLYAKRKVVFYGIFSYYTLYGKKVLLCYRTREVRGSHWDKKGRYGEGDSSLQG